MASPIILLTGASGQLGLTVQSQWASSKIAEHFQLVPVSRKNLDICDKPAVKAAFLKFQPSIVINASAFTGVDQAESEQELAYSVNEIAVENLAEQCKINSSRLIHISTDFVFSGIEGDVLRTTPYKSSSMTAPTGIYGASKLAGEIAAIRVLPQRTTIIRTSWLYSEFNKNFVKTMLRLMAERDSLGVVADQIGSPTSTRSLARLIFAVAMEKNSHGVFHWCDKGQISWFEFASAIFSLGLKHKLLSTDVTINPISTEDYPTPAKRPSYSVLDCSTAVSAFDVEQNPWRHELDEIMKRLTEDGVHL